MSLLDSGPDAVEVFVEEESTDEYGNVVMAPSDTAVVVHGRVQPASAKESQALGQVVTTLYRFISRTFPGGPFARVDYDGRSWDVVGQPRRHQGSPQTRHFTTYLRER